LAGEVAKTQYYTATSIDGFIADPGNSLDWLFQVEQGPDVESSTSTEDRFGSFFSGVGAMAMGAATYEWALEHGDLQESGKWREYYGQTPCWVFTHRQLPLVPGANLVFARGDVRDVHEQMMAAADGKNVWPGSSRIRDSLTRSCSGSHRSCSAGGRPSCRGASSRRS
jgi:hypothetical protein